MSKTVYIDTTIPSYYFDESEKLKFQSQITQKWFKDEADAYTVFLSEATINELQTGDYPHKREILKFATQFEILPNDSEIFEIANIYVQNFVMPKDSEGDALHLAFVSYYKIDFLLTWNCNHLANANKKQHIRVINTKLNLHVPEIITPMELFKESI